MAESKESKKGKSSTAAALAIEREAAKVGDPQAQKMLRASRSLGNDELQKRIQSGNATRDELMTFLTQRLGTLREVQLREMEAAKNIEDWRFNVADSHKTDHTKPDPTRWAAAARVYEEAAHQLARGSLARGAELVERALNAEQKTFGGLSAVVDVHDIEGEVETEGPAALGEVAPGQACGECPVPGAVSQLAAEIQAVTEKAVDPPVRRRTMDPWWTLDEDEEEEKADGGA